MAIAHVKNKIFLKSFFIAFLTYSHIAIGTVKPGQNNADQRLVGTDAYLKFVQSMTPGASWGKQFINKYKKKKN